MIKQFLRRALGADRPRVIAVIGVTREEVAAGVAHALTAGEALPVWAWCGEKANPLPGCERFVSGASASRVWKDLQSAWPALSIVSWTGERGFDALKLVALAIPPFRVVAFNESHGFFAVRAGGIASHARRRVRDSGVSGARRIGDWVAGGGQWIASVRYRSMDRGHSYFLAVLAGAAQITPPLTRIALKRMSGAGKIEQIKLEPVSGCLFTEVTIQNRGWPRGAVLRALENAAADFIVFRQAGERAPAEPLVALAAEANAFAVSRQIAWSGWRDVVVAKHPFRRLQPGEVTQVAAPYSSLIAVRRDVLARFGVSRALTYGGALMVLFRRAEAAGLASLVTAYGDVVADESGMALEDAELAVQLALGPALRNHAAERPERSRGNVTWSQLHTRPFRGKPRVLIVSPYLPFPLAHGGAVRIYNLCRTLAGEIDYVLACFREANETIHYAELHEVFREVYAVDTNEKHSDADVPRQVAEYRNFAMADLVRRMCMDGGIQLLQLEYTQMAEYRKCAGHVPVILVEHDITFSLHSQFADVLPGIRSRNESNLWLRFEEDALRSVNAVWTMSNADRAAAVEHGAESQTTMVVPNGVDLARFRPLARRENEQTILFVGSFRHLPNLLAFEALCDRVMPAVWEACPDAKLHVIAGPNHVAAVKMAGKLRLLNGDARVTIEGFVEDVRPAYRECDVVVVPLPVSAGTNIKLMEAMACGRAVVCTPTGCRGLDVQDSRDLLIREIGSDFSSAITLLLWDEALRQRIAARAQETAQDCFDWKSIGYRALESYATLLRQPAAGSMQLQRVSI